MCTQPALHTERLVLRPFTLADAPDVQRLAGDRDVAATVGDIPHPYEDGLAEQWIAGHEEQFRKGDEVVFAITKNDDGHLIGAIGLHLKPGKAAFWAELGYWIGKPWWNRGYATEAAGAVLEYGFETLGLNRIQASHFGNNPASGRVMQKIGMTFEGCRRQYHHKWGSFEDSMDYGILKAQYEALKKPS